MKVKLLVDWAGRQAGDTMELSDAKALRVIATGLVEKVKVSKKKSKSKEQSDVRTEETSGI